MRGYEHMRVEDGGCGLGIFWLAGWLFTIGYLKLDFWKAVIAIVVWPYYLGKHYKK